MNVVNVIVNRGNVVENNYAFVGTKIVATRFAETKFKEVAGKYGMTSDNFTKKEIEDMLDEGVYEAGDISVCLSFPEM